MSDKLHKNTILIYGGSFDPPHFGHLDTALNVQHYFRFEQFIFLPCKTPLLKKNALASPLQRLEMLQILIKGYPEFSISTIELDRDTPSYMSETLEQFRRDYGPEVSITLLLGRDAFLNLQKWHGWEKIPKLCNVLMIHRSPILLGRVYSSSSPPMLRGLSAESSAGSRALYPAEKPRDVVGSHWENLNCKHTLEETIPESLTSMFVNCRSNPLELLKSPCGKLAYFDAGSYPISSTDIRHKIQAKMNTDFGLPKEIEDYIQFQGLYKKNKV